MSIQETATSLIPGAGFAGLWAEYGGLMGLVMLGLFGLVVMVLRSHTKSTREIHTEWRSERDEWKTERAEWRGAINEGNLRNQMLATEVGRVADALYRRASSS